MGLLRIILALSVLADHIGAPSRYLHLAGSQAAVEGFFVTSGYLIFLILDTKYSNYRKFVMSRALRIYPAYLFVLCLYLAWHFIDPAMFPIHKGLIAVNLVLLGLDIFVMQRIASHTSQSGTIMVGQAWTLSLELYFYILAPFLAKVNKYALVAITSIPLALKFIFLVKSNAGDPFTYRFFPFEIGFFLLGGCSFRFLKFNNKWIGFIGLVFASTWSLFGQGRSIGPHNYASMLFPFVIAVALPSLKSLDQYRLVRGLGNLSYPLYLIHIFMGMLISFFFAKMNYQLSESIHYWLVLGFSLIFAYCIHRSIDLPIEKYRRTLQGK